MREKQLNKKIKELQRELEILTTEEVLVDKIARDTVSTVSNLIIPALKSKTDAKVKSEIEYRIIAKRKGRKITCTLYDDLGRVLGQGVSICHEDDEFDDVIGYYLAQCRARQDWNKRSERSFLYRHGLV